MEVVNNMTHNEWLDNIVSILSSTDVPQITGKLISFDEHDNMIGKCALGVISCEVGIPLMNRGDNEVSYNRILSKANVPSELNGVQDVLPSLYIYTTSKGVESVFFNECTTTDLASYIYLLNDNGLSFNEIAEFLEVTFGDY